MPGARADEVVIGDDLRPLRPRGGGGRGGGTSAQLLPQPPVCEASLSAAAAEAKRSRCCDARTRRITCTSDPVCRLLSVICYLLAVICYLLAGSGFAPACCQSATLPRY